MIYQIITVFVRNEFDPYQVCQNRQNEYSCYGTHPEGVAVGSAEVQPKPDARGSCFSSLGARAVTANRAWHIIHICVVRQFNTVVVVYTRAIIAPNGTIEATASLHTAIGIRTTTGAYIGVGEYR